MIVDTKIMKLDIETAEKKINNLLDELKEKYSDFILICKEETKMGYGSSGQELKIKAIVNPYPYNKTS